MASRCALMVLTTMLLLTFATPGDTVLTAGCHWVDHQECNDMCLIDSFWYGTCTSWDGVQLSCRCYPYRSPLNGSICSQLFHKGCQKECVEKGRRGGYCYPQLATETSIEPNCACIE
ncbi:unnamed protein product [Soboliphyme baturini]|uniref:Secreted protein n=1 Tax=Soboliphyme baturini TaxID=241478 RepID=A0A183IEV9_9BILA|nr:unnamed protein product [Soboliphyme baturini]